MVTWHLIWLKAPEIFKSSESDDFVHEAHRWSELKLSAVFLGFVEKKQGKLK